MSSLDDRLIWLLAGSLHFLQLPSMALFFVRILRFGPELAKLAPVVQRVFYVIAGAIVITVTGLGLVVVMCVDELARGSRLSTSLALFLACFFGYRAGAQVAYGPVWPQTARLERFAHFALLAVFSSQFALYALAALRGAAH